MQSWTRYTTSGASGQKRPTESVEFGPGEVVGLDRRLLGDVAGLRVLDLGTGAGNSAIALARQGARVVAIDPVLSQVELARRSAEKAEVHVELHHADLADLAFLTADTFDAIISVHALASVSDLGRVFRQTHRVLKPDRPLVVSLPHPAALMLSPDTDDTIVSAYHASEVLGRGAHLTHRHGIAQVFTQLTRANYRVDMMLEPIGPDLHPASVIFRARKVGT